ncbi:ABC transporter ATP-binding protein [Mycetocola zhujimingii]|uniref:ABC transporter ATP-binding protein n=1 Tax=Mycetocola zhujimingii TaxID=2079792 RepID=UPI0018E0AADB|nr:ABC transporter ATP-binding protein [Mycetocola zhujimingii]
MPAEAGASVDTPTPAPLLAVRDLTVTFDVDGQTGVGVDSASFDVGHGEVVAIVGESGSGKSVTAMSVLGLLPGNATVSGSIRFDGRELLGLSNTALRGVRGAQIAMIFQDPLAALNPVFTIGFQLSEAVRAHDRKLSAADARARVIELLTLVEIPDPESRLKYYPHQFSGGQCQRIVIAMALARDARLLIADEPTTALDVTVQAEILDVLRRMRERLDSSILIITHDMGVVADLADRVVVMKRGSVVESNTARGLFHAPKAAYTRDLLAAVPRFGERGDTATPDTASNAVLDIRNLVVQYGGRLSGYSRAVDDVTLCVRKGEIFGLVGESGSGKTTIGRASIGMAPITSGTIEVGGIRVDTRNRADRLRMRRGVGVVFQNLATSLNPRYSVAETVSEPLRVHGRLAGSELRDRTDALLESVGLDGRWRDRYPHELSGGQRQRVAIARAVSLGPDLLIADEPTSALDVSVQAQVLDVFRGLQERLGFACLFISHDLAVVDTLCDRVAVMSRGTIIEQGGRDEVLNFPQHDYTRTLIASAPVPDPDEQQRRRLARLAV